jgi:hypothetical protein
VPIANSLISWELLPPEQKVGGSNPLGRTTKSTICDHKVCRGVGGHDLHVISNHEIDGARLARGCVSETMYSGVALGFVETCSLHRAIAAVAAARTIIVVFFYTETTTFSGILRQSASSARRPMFGSPIDAASQPQDGPQRKPPLQTVVASRRLGRYLSTNARQFRGCGKRSRLPGKARRTAADPRRYF